MTTYNTGNPIGSTDARDLYDNAQNLDTAINGSGLTWVDRLGVTRPTYQGAIDDAATRAEFSAGDGASKIGYTPAGTGAVATTVQSKLRETVSVKDFGAVGDGVANDTTAIQNALNTGKSVFLPEGTYVINAPLVLTNDGQHFFGAGRQSVLYKLAGSTHDAMVKILGGAYPAAKRSLCCVRDMTIYSAAVTTTDGIWVKSGERNVISNVNLNGFTRGIYQDQAIITWVHRAAITGCIHGVYSEWTITNLGSWLYLTECYLSGNVAGATINDTPSTYLERCIIVGNSDYGVFAQRTDGKAGLLCDNVVIRGCDIDSNGNNGIRLRNLKRPIVSDTWISSGRTNLTDGLSAYGCDELALSNLTAFNNGANGAKLDSCTNTSVVAGKFSGNRTAGLYTISCTYLAVLGATARPEGVGYTQPVGISINGGDYAVLVGNISTGHTAANIYDGAGANSKRLGNPGVEDRYLGGVTVSALPSASSVGQNARRLVINATSTTLATVVSGGGSNIVPVYSDGTSWRIG